MKVDGKEEEEGEYVPDDPEGYFGTLEVLQEVAGEGGSVDFDTFLKIIDANFTDGISPNDAAALGLGP